MPTSDADGDEQRCERLRESLVRKISGFTPALTGTLCDACNRGLAAGEAVTLLATRYTKPNGTESWALQRTHCRECAEALGSEPERVHGTEAAVRCELGEPTASGGAAPLYNPDVIRITVGPDLRDDSGDEEDRP
jgi:hypothetical protein